MIVRVIHLYSSPHGVMERTNNPNNLRRNSEADKQFPWARMVDGFVGFLQVAKHISSELSLVDPNFSSLQPTNIASVVDR